MKELDLSPLGIRRLPPFVLIDTNLFVLYVVGMVDSTRISAERATKMFTGSDFEVLFAAISRFREIRVTPNILTEAGNLLDRTRDPFRARVRAGLASIVSQVKERYIRSADAVEIPHYHRVGLADSATLEAGRKKCLVLTDDLALYLALQEKGIPSLNFNHLRAL